MRVAETHHLTAFKHRASSAEVEDLPEWSAHQVYTATAGCSRAGVCTSASGISASAPSSTAAVTASNCAKRGHEHNQERPLKGTNVLAARHQNHVWDGNPMVD